ncbi:hypothetical protein A2U01_0078467, partial [Trifolium medium]|nr:hypothetical protein [Trifolium medium]
LYRCAKFILEEENEVLSLVYEIDCGSAREENEVLVQVNDVESASTHSQASDGDSSNTSSSWHGEEFGEG